LRIPLGIAVQTYSLCGRPANAWSAGQAGAARNTRRAVSFSWTGPGRKHTMDDRQRRLAMDDERPHWHSRGPPGVPREGWFISAFFAFPVVILGGWEWGWWEPSHPTAAAPTQSHRMTTGVGH